MYQIVSRFTFYHLDIIGNPYHTTTSTAVGLGNQADAFDKTARPAFHTIPNRQILRLMQGFLVFKSGNLTSILGQQSPSTGDNGITATTAHDRFDELNRSTRTDTTRGNGKLIKRYQA